VNATSAPVTAVGPNSTNNTNSFNAASPSDNVVSPTFKIGGKSSFMDPSHYPDDPKCLLWKTLFIHMMKKMLTRSMARMVKEQGGLTQINDEDFHTSKILRKFGLTYGKSASTPIDTKKPLLKDPNGKDYQVDEQDGIAVTAVRYFLNAVSSKLMLFGLTINAAHLMLLDHNSSGSQDLQNTDADAAFDVKENESEVYVSPSSSDKTKTHNEKAK
nr:hypothetical protein [Tanacetum cinerariifolium]